MKPKSMNYIFSFLYVLFLSSFSLPMQSALNMSLYTLLSPLPFITTISTPITQLVNFSWQPYLIGFYFVFITFYLLVAKFVIKINKITGLIYIYLIWTSWNVTLYLGLTKMAVYTPLLIMILLMYFGSIDTYKFSIAENKFSKLIFVISIIDTGLIIFNFIYRMSGEFIISLDYFRSIRSTGIMYDSTLCAVLQGMYLWNALTSYRSKLSKRGLIFVLVFYIFGGLFTGSRTFIILLLIIIMFSLLSSKNKKSKLVIFTLITVCIVLTISQLVMLLDTANTYVEDAVRESKRILAVNMIKERPLFGHGPSEYMVRESLYRSFGSNPHNYYLQLLVEVGMMGSIPFYMAFLYTFFRAIKYKQVIQMGYILIWAVSATSTGISSCVLLMFILYFNMLSVIRKEPNTKALKV